MKEKKKERDILYVLIDGKNKMWKWPQHRNQS